MIEKWRGLIYQDNDYSQYYEVSNFGKLRNARTHKILKQTIGKTGYYGYCGSLGSRQKKKMFKIHKAVAETFINNPNNHKIINHIDGNKLNNNINNLEWCTYQHNSQHAIALGLTPSTKERMQNAPNCKIIKGTNIKTNKIVTFPSILEASRFLGNTNKAAHIGKVINGKRKTAYGYKWECV